MTTITISFYGNRESGKTRLIQRFKSGQFEEGPEDRSGVYFQISQKNGAKLTMWDIKGERKDLVKPYLKNCNACIYTIDLSEEFNEEQFIRDLDLIQESSSEAPIILVGCKNDLNAKISPAQLEELRLRYNLSKSFTTSALNGEGIDELFTFVANLGSAHKIQTSVVLEPGRNRFTLEEMKALLKAPNPLSEAIANLEALTAELPQKYQNKINDAMIDLISDLINPNKDKQVAIENFVQTSKQALTEARKLGLNKDTLARVTKGVLILAAASLITMAVASAVLGIGPITLVLAAAVGASIAGSVLLARRGMFKCSFNSALNQITSAVEDEALAEDFIGLSMRAQG